MQSHTFNKGKFPVADQAIHYFSKIILSKLDCYCWVAGGAITSFMSGQKIKDIDLFFNSRNEAAKAVIQLRKQFKFKLLFATDKAIKGIAEIQGRKVKIDIVKTLFPNPIACINEFDFTVCCFAVSKTKFFYHPNAPFDILRKKLVINNLPFPVSTVRRMNKYIKRGYSACNGTIMEILTEVRNVNPEDFGLVDFYPVD